MRISSFDANRRATLYKAGRELQSPVFTITGMHHVACIKGLSSAAAALLVDPDEPLYRTVVCSLYVVGKITRRKFTATTMVGNAFAADAFSGTGLVSAVAPVLVLLDRTGSHGSSFFGNRPEILFWTVRVSIDFFQSTLIENYEENTVESNGF